MPDPDFIDMTAYAARDLPAETERAWAAGFFDGEGHIGIHNTSKSGHTYLKMAVVQTELTTLERFNLIVGSAGRIYERTKYQPSHWSRSWVLQINTQGGVIYAINILWPYLSQPKRDQATEAFAKRSTYRAKWPAEFKLPQQRLTDDQVREIRALYAAGEMPRAAIALKYGVDAGSIYRIGKRQMRASVI